MCGGWRKYGRFGGQVMADRTRWRVEVRYHVDDTTAQILKAHGVARYEAEMVAEEQQKFLDHDVFYTELVELD